MSTLSLKDNPFSEIFRHARKWNEHAINILINKEIDTKIIFTLCTWFPKEICTLINEYTVEEIYLRMCTDYYPHPKIELFIIHCRSEHTPPHWCNFTLHISKPKYSKKKMMQITLCLNNSESMRMYDRREGKDESYLYVAMLNTYMKSVYGKNEYIKINHLYSRSDVQFSYITNNNVFGNMICFKYATRIGGIYVLDHKKFKHMIIIIKLLIKKLMTKKLITSIC